MLHVPPSEFSSFGSVDLEMISSRPRSCSLFDPTDIIDLNSTFRRPRSRSFYTLEDEEKNENKQIFKLDTGKQKDKNSWSKPAPKRSKTNQQKHQSKDHRGSRGNHKNIPMLTISEPDSWKISSSSGMKYGHYVDWEKIDPAAASRLNKIISSDHAELKEMARSGFWVSPHTLRAKSYQHIIQHIECTSITEDSERYRDLAQKIFDKHGESTYPFPKFMKDGEIPRYCLNKSGLNSVKKILLCVSENFPDVTFCPILPALVSLLLHYSEDEAQCFHSICSLVTYTDPKKRYIDQNFITTHSSCMTFGDLANRYCKGIRKLIASSHQSLFEFYSDWIMWIFADLPFSYAIRVLDVYLIEGYKVLYRVALALLSLYKVSVSSRVADVDDFKQDMKRFVENVSRHSNVDDLLQRAFSIPLPTRSELHFLYHANKLVLIQKGIQHESCYPSVELDRFSSSVVSETEMRVVWSWIPERFALFSPTRLYSTEQHVRDLTSFYSHVDGHEPTVLLLKTVDEEVCGAFLSSDWILRKHDRQRQFFGTGECFVFTLRPAMERYQRAILSISGTTKTKESSMFSSSSPSSSCESVKSCPNSPAMTSQFMNGTNEMLLIGGDGGHALSLFSDLTVGQSECCDTFESPVLCRGKFRIHSLEVWGIQTIE